MDRTHPGPREYGMDGFQAADEAPFEAAMRAAERGDWMAARAMLEALVAAPELALQARLLLWEVCQAQGDAAAGVAHLRNAVTGTPVIVRPSAAPARHVLALAVIGDFQANLPLGCLLDAERTGLATLWIADPQAVLADPAGTLPRNLPPFDCVFIAIAEDVRHAGALAAADAWAACLAAPVINSGARIAAVSRDGAARLLADLPEAVVPAQHLLTRAALHRPALPAGLAFPLLIRPRGAHAGQGLARVADGPELTAYLADGGLGDLFYVAPFVDFRSADGQWRKYRVIFVDGRPFPFHLAVHDDWAIWYYNAGMDRDAGKRAEEARFLEDITAAFPPRAMTALAALAERVGLDYFGLDCALMPDGRLLVFEVETGMIVHDTDPADLYPYKKRCVPRIFRAVEAMLDARIAQARAGLSPVPTRSAAPAAASP